MRTAMFVLAGSATLTLLSIGAMTLRERPEWMETLRALPTQQDGRVMPLDSSARRLAARITGRARWSASRGPAGYAGREPIQLVVDLLFRPEELVDTPLVRVQNRPFKRRVGLDEERDFFSPAELARTERLIALVTAFHKARQVNPDAQPTPDQDKALAVNGAVAVVAAHLRGQPLPLVPSEEGAEFRHVSLDGGDAGTAKTQAALTAFGKAYLADQELDKPAVALREAIASDGSLTPRDARSVRFELAYNDHSPWRMALVASVLGAIGIGFGGLFKLRWLWIAGLMFAGWAVIEQALGLGLRTVILGRAPVSNMYESILWMGLVALIVGGVAQALRPTGQYLLGGLIASVLSIIFAMLIPLEQQMNALPAVLRSNYWLILHVLVIVASYGLFALAAVLAHAHLVSAALRGRARRPSTLGNPLITQIYRMVQLGLVLLTAGTILGGVWAADSWGRFWGWDPKETWALISIIVYFAMLHARYVGWLRDFGLAVASIIGFMAIVWTFYGVNYVMASGLHSYGFGAGGWRWVALWGIIEMAFVLACALWLRHAHCAAPLANALAPERRITTAAV